MGKKAFTIIEIIAVVIIVGILATLGLPVYQNIIESSKAKACATNLETIKKAVDIYVMEHDAVPGSMSELTPRQLEKAYAQVMRSKGAWKKRLAALIVRVSQSNTIAYAQTGGQSYGLPHLHCPLDTSSNGISYGLNSAIVNKSSREYRDLQTNPMTSNTVLVGDANTATLNFANASIELTPLLVQRGHKQYGFAGTTRLRYLLAISVTGQVGTTVAEPYVIGCHSDPGGINSGCYNSIVH